MTILDVLDGQRMVNVRKILTGWEPIAEKVAKNVEMVEMAVIS